MTSNFVEVHVDCALEQLEDRDPKGLYARARAGEIERFTGISDPYEAPEHPDVRVDSGTQQIHESVAAILACLEEKALIPGIAST